ncbi:MAG: hypothetical protein K6G69_06740 [Lachnospiraceae bacterium]|nr:hypothetical protein [Lachnospiraceae bacterium]
MKIKKIHMIILTCALLGATGCAIPTVVDLSEEQEEMIIEYSADLLKKYDPKMSNNILTEEQLAKEEQKEAEQKAKQERVDQLREDYLAKNKAAEDNKKQEKEKESSDNEKSDEQVQSGPMQIDNTGVAEFLSIADLKVEYMGYDTMRSYPGDAGDAAFSVDASAGKQLVVTYLDVTNSGSSDVYLDMFSDDATYSLQCGNDTVPKCNTLLLNDFTIYKDTVGSGKTIETVIIFEVDEGASIDGAKLLINDDVKVGQIML